MPRTEEIEEALALIDELCNIDQIKSVLRKRRDNDKVRLSAENKEQLIKRNLRDGLESGAVPMEDAWDLIRSAEENGAQHIYYYKLKPNLQKFLHPEAVAERLFGSKWQKAVSSFPDLAIKPESYLVSDFRPLKNKPLDWILKIYGHTTLIKATGNTKPEDDGRFWREYQEVPLRSVLLARWNHPDLLEIRVQSDDSRRRIDDWQGVLWKYLQPALIKDQFTPWKLSKALNKLVIECKKHKILYTFRDAGVLDKQEKVIAHFETVSDQGDLLESQRSIDNLIEYVKEGGTLKGLAITWLSEKTSLEKDYRTLVGSRQDNEVLFQAKCSAGDIDHVTDQLRRFS
jgi:hypothetical protein